MSAGGEYSLNVDSDLATGTIKYITYDSGISIADFDMIFHHDILLIEKISHFNPIHFSYCSEGYYQHKFSDEADYKKIKTFHSVISTGKKGIDHHLLFSKGVHIKTNNIQIIRQEFQSKSSFDHVTQLSKKLYATFVDHNEETSFIYFAPINIDMEEQVKAIRTSKSEGIMRILQIEGRIYNLISMHLEQYEKDQNNTNYSWESNLLTHELGIIQKFAYQIIDDPSASYTLENVMYQTGLTQPKSQEGFKYLFSRTVIDYIRHIRLEKARDLFKVKGHNVSEVVYKVGFSSRSYFTKIFKEKYGLTPTDYKNSYQASHPSNLLDHAHAHVL